MAKDIANILLHHFTSMSVFSPTKVVILKASKPLIPAVSSPLVWGAVAKSDSTATAGAVL